MSDLEKKYDKEIIKILEGFGYLGDTDYGTEYFSCIGNQEANTPFDTLKLLNKFKDLQQENTTLKQQLKDIEEYLESIKDMPDADMYIKLGEYEEFKHILNLIHRGK